jgi:hypothetical protein
MTEMLYRLRYAWHFWRATRWPLRACLAAAWAFDMEFVDGLSPSESVDEELYCMAQDAE